VARGKCQLAAERAMHLRQEHRELMGQILPACCVAWRYILSNAVQWGYRMSDNKVE
jgi:hypothetical protein